MVHIKLPNPILSLILHPGDKSHYIKCSYFDCLICTNHQSSKKTKNVRNTNFVMKMSDFHISVKNSQTRRIFIMKIVLKLVFIHLWWIVIQLCFIFSKIMSQIFIKMYGFLQNNVPDPKSQDPNFLELCKAPHILYMLSIYHLIPR